jgi:hypothetical protein
MKYHVMWYLTGAMALRQSLAPKRQLFQLSARKCGASKEQLQAAFAQLLDQLHAGSVQVGQAQGWVTQRVAEAVAGAGRPA